MTENLKVICGFQGEYRWLSNFWPASINFDTMVFPSVEHAYQAAKSLDPQDWKDAAECVSPGAAKRLGRTFKIRPDWEKIKLDVMAQCLVLKFQNPDLQARLLDTGNSIFIEDNTWGDTFWGVCRGKGQNHLGRLLMNVREDIRISQALS